MEQYDTKNKLASVYIFRNTARQGFWTRLVSYNYKNYKRRHNLIENDIPRWQGGTMLLVHSFFDYKICSQNCLNVKKTCLIWGSDTLSVLNAHLGAHTIIHGAPNIQTFFAIWISHSLWPVWLRLNYYTTKMWGHR